MATRVLILSLLCYPLNKWLKQNTLCLPSGQLGYGNTDTIGTATTSGSMANCVDIDLGSDFGSVTAIAVGGYQSYGHSCALSTDTNLIACWGMFSDSIQCLVALMKCLDIFRYHWIYDSPLIWFVDQWHWNRARYWGHWIHWFVNNYSPFVHVLQCFSECKQQIF